MSTITIKDAMGNVVCSVESTNSVTDMGIESWNPDYDLKDLQQSCESMERYIIAAQVMSEEGFGDKVKAVAEKVGTKIMDALEAIIQYIGKFFTFIKDKVIGFLSKIYDVISNAVSSGIFKRGQIAAKETLKTGFRKSSESFFEFSLEADHRDSALHTSYEAVRVRSMDDVKEWMHDNPKYVAMISLLNEDRSVNIGEYSELIRDCASTLDAETEKIKRLNPIFVTILSKIQNDKNNDDLSDIAAELNKFDSPGSATWVNQRLPRIAPKDLSKYFNDIRNANRTEITNNDVNEFMKLYLSDGVSSYNYSDIKKMITRLRELLVELQTVEKLYSKVTPEMLRKASNRNGGSVVTDAIGHHIRNVRECITGIQHVSDVVKTVSNVNMCWVKFSKFLTGTE